MSSYFDRTFLDCLSIIKYGSKFWEKVGGQSSHEENEQSLIIAKKAAKKSASAGENANKLVYLLFPNITSAECKCDSILF